MIGQVLRAPFAGRTWREFAYAVVGFLLSIPAFLLVPLGIAASVLSLLTIGLPLLVGVLFAARGTVRYFRAPARKLLGWDWPSPPRRDGRTPVRWGIAVLRDGAAWRAWAYCWLKFPLMAAAAYIGGVLLIVGTLAATYPLWWQVAPAGFGTDSADWGDALLLCVEGIAAVLVFPWFVRLLVTIDRLLIRALLGPDPDRARIAALEASRADLRADAAALLRRVERDLHDGTQARLVSLGLALARIEQRVDDPQTRTLAANARTGVEEALAELREIVRGMHPPALDDGLPTALRTLAARSALPVDLTLDLADRPSAQNASALYFVAAELLTNAVRHSGARRVHVDLREVGDRIRLAVTDDGSGGAAVDPAGTGLAGLERRVRAIDGTLEISSPPGGPTTVVAVVPKE